MRCNYGKLLQNLPQRRQRNESCTRICVIFILFRVSWWQRSDSWELIVVGVGGTRKMWGDGLGFLGGSAEKKNPPAVQETHVPSLGQEDSLEKEMAAHSSILAWRIPWTEEPGGLHSPWGCKRVRHDVATEPPPPVVYLLTEFHIFFKNNSCFYKNKNSDHILILPSLSINVLKLFFIF